MRPGERPNHPLRSFTLVEVMLALVLASLVGLTVLIMLNALGAAAQSRFDTRYATVDRQLTTARLGACTRASAMTLATSDDVLVLWTGDANSNDVPDLSELRRFEWIGATSEVWIFESPENLDPLLDVPYSFDDDFLGITAAAAASSTLPGRLLLDDVTAWEAAFDHPDVQAARTLRLRVTTEPPTGEATAVVIASFRAAGG